MQARGKGRQLASNVLHCEAPFDRLRSWHSGHSQACQEQATPCLHQMRHGKCHTPDDNKSGRHRYPHVSAGFNVKRLQYTRVQLGKPTSTTSCSRVAMRPRRALRCVSLQTRKVGAASSCSPLFLPLLFRGHPLVLPCSPLFRPFAIRCYGQGRVLASACIRSVFLSTSCIIQCV